MISNYKLMVHKIMSQYQGGYVVSQLIVDELLKTPELKYEAKIHRMLRREGGDGWDAEKTTNYLQKTYRKVVRRAIMDLRKQKFVETVELEKVPKGKVTLCKSKLTKKEVAHRITEAGIKKLG